MPTLRKPPSKRHSKESANQVERLKQELRIERQARQKAELRCVELERIVESQARKIDELTRKVDQLLNGQRKTEELLHNEIRQLQANLRDRDEKIEEQGRQIAWFQKNYFGKKSEKRDDNGDRDQDDEANLESDQTTAEEVRQKKKRGQQPGSKGHGRTQQTKPIDREEIPVPAPKCACSACGKPYRKASFCDESIVREIALVVTELVYQLEKLVPDCDCPGQKPVTAPPPPKLYPRTNIGNTIWVHLAIRKFLYGEPHSRTLAELSLNGYTLAQGTITGGNKIINELLTPLYEAIVDRCRGADLWNADETTWRVFDSDKIRWWLWLVASDDAVAYLLDQSRSKKVPQAFFAGSTGILMTDRLASYKGLGNAIRKAWCWVHQKRDLLKIYEGTKKEWLRQWSKDWLLDITKLFVLNHQRFELWKAGKDWKKAHELVVQQTEKIKQKWESQLRLPNLQKCQKTALTSMKKHWEGLTIFLCDPRIPMDNNRAERLLRNAVIVRKNSYGSGSAWSGNMAAKYFSIFQTWLINGLDPQALLLDYFNQCAQNKGKPPPDVSPFLPWSMSEERKQAFALPKNYKRPG